MARDAYGRTPLDPDYGMDTLPPAGKDPLTRLKGEFAQRLGRKRRGRGWNEPEEDNEALHEYHLSHVKPASKRGQKSPPRGSGAETAESAGAGGTRCAALSRAAVLLGAPRQSLAARVRGYRASGREGCR